MRQECIYIAGPMCFYADGYPRWYVMRDRAKVKGFAVSMPNDKELKLDHEDLRKNADTIFANCCDCMNETTAIICNLEFYRGPDVDGGSLYEVGMAYAKGARCYGYTRDKRPMVWKYQGSVLRDGTVYDQKGRPLPYGDLPFSPNVIGSMKIVEGDFDDCLQVFSLDTEELRKRETVTELLSSPPPSSPRGGTPVIYLAGPERYDSDCLDQYDRMKALCRERGLQAVVPTDPIPDFAPADSDDPYVNAYRVFLRQQQHVRDCDILLANLNDFHNWEPDSDTSFECGMAFQLGKALYGYMSDTRRMVDRIPNLGPSHDYRDACGCNAENFDYPINLMFSSSMPIWEGTFEDALERTVADLKRKGLLH